MVCKTRGSREGGRVLGLLRLTEKMVVLRVTEKMVRKSGGTRRGSSRAEMVRVAEKMVRKSGGTRRGSRRAEMVRVAEKMVRWRGCEERMEMVRLPVQMVSQQHVKSAALLKLKQPQVLLLCIKIRRGLLSL